MAALRIAPVARLRSVPATSSGKRVRRKKALADVFQFAHDLTIQQGPNRVSPIIKHGPHTGGRSAVSGHVATVFGCTGFLGRYLVHKLAKQGTQVIVPYRDEDEKRHLRVTGDLGQVVPMEWDARSTDQIKECIRHSDVVYNLAGRDWETRNFSYDDINVKAAGRIAAVAAEHGTPRLVHLSHLNASADSTSRFYQSKYAGERAVRDAFPEATIVRPAGMYGHEDWLLNQMAQWPIFYKLNNGRTRILPVHVLDVAEALSVMLNAPVTSTASTFQLAGPAVHTYNSLLQLVAAMTMKPMTTAPVLPKPAALLFATLVNRGLWWPTISPDEIERKYIDDAGVDAFNAPVADNAPAGWQAALGAAKATGIDGEAVKSWQELDMEPDHIEEHAIKFLRRYRSSANFDQPAEIGQFKRPKPYHVVP